MSADPLMDKTGQPLLAGDSWVRDERPNPLAPSRALERQGHLETVTSDAKGALLYVREWKAGRFTGRLHVTRPEYVEVVRAPDKAREELAETARRRQDAKVRKEREEVEARLKKLRAQQAKEKA